MPQADDFGASAWFVLHYIASAYPDEPSDDHKEKMKQLVSSIQYLYPCGSCSPHFAAYLTSIPVDVSSREALERWIYDFHTAVNIRTNKNPVTPHTFEEVQKFFRSRSYYQGFGGFPIVPRKMVEPVRRMTEDDQRVSDVECPPCENGSSSFSQPKSIRLAFILSAVLLSVVAVVAGSVVLVNALKKNKSKKSRVVFSPVN